MPHDEDENENREGGNEFRLSARHDSLGANKGCGNKSLSSNCNVLVKNGTKVAAAASTTTS